MKHLSLHFNLCNLHKHPSIKMTNLLFNNFPVREALLLFITLIFFITGEGRCQNLTLPYISSECKDGLRSAEDWNGKYGYLDCERTYWAILARFSDTRSFSEGLASVKTNKEWGYINKKGKFVIRPQYENAWSFSEDRAFVRMGGKWGIINRKGIYIVEPQFEDGGSFKEGFAAVKINNKYGFVDKSGRITIQPQFDKVSSFNHGLSFFSFDGKKGYVDKVGNITVVDSLFFYLTLIDTDKSPRVGIPVTLTQIGKDGQPSLSFYITDTGKHYRPTGVTDSKGNVKLLVDLYFPQEFFDFVITVPDSVKYETCLLDNNGKRLIISRDFLLQHKSLGEIILRIEKN